MMGNLRAVLAPALAQQNSAEIPWLHSPITILIVQGPPLEGFQIEFDLLDLWHDPY